MVNLLLRTLVLGGAFAAVLTEALSPFHLLRRGPVSTAWVIAAGACILWWRRSSARPRFSLRPLEIGIGVAILLIVTGVGITAAISPPNSADAMAYHLPRVIYWAQAGSVAFFPTTYFNQITLSPFNEYLMLHTYLVTGGDHLVNLLTFAAFLGCIIGVVALSGALGLGRTGQAFAALFCATLPNAILQASGAKNDLLLALYLVLTIYFVMRGDAAFAGLSLGLALATKATGYLFAPPLILAVLIAGKRDWRRIGAWLAAGVLLVNAPQYWRNVRLSGSPLGYDSAQGDGFFRWRNEHPGWRSTASNALRNLSEQLGTRNARWNQAVFDTVVRIHQSLGIDPQDQDATWRWSRYEPPRNANHEANANNRWHLLILAMAAALLIARRERAWLLYVGGLATAFLLFCFYLKFQPFQARLEVPLFLLAAPVGAYLLDAVRPRWAAVGVCIFLFTGARLPVLQNWTRPLRGRDSLFVTRRDDNYFSDMSQWDNRASYLHAVDVTARSRCREVGIDISENQLEYPFQALLREHDPLIQFVHTGVENASARYAPNPAIVPCAVLCLDCAGNQKKISLYTPIGEPSTIGRFLLFLKH